ncbi:hypothetical protein CCMA1212_005739 [Trichoderma ghanense]|uniref:Nephrocystin 3-like N-terminal domain-containing protein n=1 Tax=Trichoderma ghanense TaxID=65468 RepID=A0ABY2H244_9HYPO
MSSQSLLPAGYGMPMKLGSIDTDSELWQRFFSDVLLRFKDDSAAVDVAASQADASPEDTVESSNIEAKKRKDEFVNILVEWDKEHDRITEASKSHKPRGNFFKGKSDLIAQVRSDISGTHSWDDVFDALREAEEAYKSPTGIKVVHKWFRKAADKSDLVEPFVDFIPSFDFSSVVCGGIKFILRACTASKKFREEAFELIDKLPEKVDVAGQYLELYRNDAQLQAASYDLFCNVLSAIQSIMYWLMKDHTFEWLKPLLQQNAYNSKIKEQIKELEQSSRRVASYVKLCNAKKLSKVSDGVGQIRQDTAWIRKSMEALVRDVYQQARWFQEMLQYWNNQAIRNLPEEPEETISQSELLLLLDPNAIKVQKAHQHILKKILRKGLAMDPEAQKRVEWLMANKKISRWFTSTGSQTLLVNGSGSADRVTPLSFFCAMLVQSLSSVGCIILLSYFCGLEMPELYSHGSKDPRTSGLLKSLLIQLLAPGGTSDITCSDHDLIDDLKTTSPNWNLQQQKKLLRFLVAALPATTPIFIFIDGTDFYEMDDLCGETKRVVKEINNLLSQENVKAMVKVLITSPTRSHDLFKYFHQKEIVIMPENMDNSSTRFAGSSLRKQFDTKAARLDRSESRNWHR